MTTPKCFSLLIFFLFLSTTVFSQIPESFIGVWNGNGVQTFPSTSWTISIVIKNEGSEIAYPSLNCGGNLTLVSASSNQLVFREKINFGVNSCVVEGNVILTVSETNPNELTFYYDSELHPGTADGMVSRTQPNSKWPNLQSLVNDYNSKLNTNRAPYAHQVLCIAQKSCAEYNANPNGWASEFVLYMFKDLIKSNGLISSQEVNCDAGTSNFSCFGKSGTYHAAELYSAFIRYCIYNRNNIDYTKWDNDHEAFLSNALTPCFLELQNSNELSLLSRLTYEKSALIYARRLREETQAFCGFLDFFDFQVPQPLKEEELLIPEIIDAGNLTISGNSPYFVAVGEEIELTVSHAQTGIDLTNSSNTNYHINISNDFVQISSEGLIEIISAPSPLVNSRDPLIVYVENNGDFGYAQFAIFDTDSDEDYIVDSYEQSVGLNPNSPNLDSLDSDFDGLYDIVEVLAKTNPLNADSDGDLYDDSFEIKAGSDPLDFDSTPLTNNVISSIKEEINTSTFDPIIYPNPSDGEIKIAIPNNQYSNISIEIIDITGRIINTENSLVQSINSDTYSFKISDLNSGIYFCIFRIKGEIIGNKKIVIR